jgi:hypothetical protein
MYLQDEQFVVVEGSRCVHFNTKTCGVFVLSGKAFMNRSDIGAILGSNSDFSFRHHVQILSGAQPASSVIGAADFLFESKAT